MMLRKWLAGKRVKVIPAKRHGVSPSDIADFALHVARLLQQNGFQAFIVGGAVRDVLLGFHPKDFDIATDASPEEVKRLFRRQALIIGRRFRIAHVYYPGKQRREFLEVSTFRAADAGDTTLVSNDVYGTAEEDAQRRDFTINGLFYDPSNGDIIDYVNGFADIGRQQIRMIGDPEKRLPEDPVRALRGIRLATKLGLKMERKLERALPLFAANLADIPHSRLFDELVKVLKSGASARILEEWQRHDVSRHIMPILDGRHPFFFSALAENDRRIAESRQTSVTFAIAALFWSPIAENWHRWRGDGLAPMRAMEKAVATAAFSQNRIIPQRLMGRAKDLFFLQALMEESPNRRRAARVLRDESFDRALSFAAARQDTGAARTASWWSQYARGDKQEQERMLGQLPPSPSKRRRKKKAAKPAADE